MGNIVSNLPSLQSLPSVENIPSVFLFIASPFLIFPFAFFHQNQNNNRKKICICENYSFSSIEERDSETPHERMLKLCYYNEDLIDFYPEKHHYDYTTRDGGNVVYQQFIVLSR